MTRTTAEVAAFVEGELVGDATRMIAGLSTPDEGGAEDLVFITSARHLSAVTSAGAALVPIDLELPPTLTAIRVPNPAASMARIVDWFFPVRRTLASVSPGAVVDHTAVLGRDVGIGPLVYIGAGVRIGDRTEVHPNSTIGEGSELGADCVIHPGVHIYPRTRIGDRVVLHSGVVIGADGFGYVRESTPEHGAQEPRRHRKVRHIGHVVIEDDVEIGANSAVDRSMLTATRIGRGTKIDNLVTIGHNTRVGRHCIIIGQAGLSGSTVLEDYVTVAGQAGVAGHVRLGAQSVIGAQSGVTKDVPPGGVVLGSPAVEARRAKKALALIDSLPEFKRTLAAQARRLAEVERAAMERSSR